jgi:hypothetical protein
MPMIGRRWAAPLTGVVPQKTVNPDEAVALRAVHAAVLDGMEGGAGLSSVPCRRRFSEQSQSSKRIGND